MFPDHYFLFRVGYWWIVRFLALGCYSLMLFPGFIQGLQHFVILSKILTHEFSLHYLDTLQFTTMFTSWNYIILGFVGFINDYLVHYTL